MPPLLVVFCLFCGRSAVRLLLVVILVLAAGQLLPVAPVAVDVVLERVALATLHAGVQHQAAVLETEKWKGIHSWDIAEAHEN